VIGFGTSMCIFVKENSLTDRVCLIVDRSNVGIVSVCCKNLRPQVLCVCYGLWRHSRRIKEDKEHNCWNVTQHVGANVVIAEELLYHKDDTVLLKTVGYFEHV